MTQLDESMIDCGWCDSRHGERYLCETVRIYLEAIRRKADGYSLPDVEFDEPVHIPPTLGDVLLRQIVIQGGTAEVAGLPRPLIVITGADSTGRPLPRWTFIATPQDLARVRNTFDRMVSLAIDAARKGRR